MRETKRQMVEPKLQVIQMICKKCSVDGNFRWDNEWYENTGSWRLWDNDRERPHECHAKPKPKPKQQPKKEKVFCPKCDPQTRKLMDKDKLQEHIKTNHIDWGNFE